jgi:plasmid stabilization system protein ParE
MPRKSLFIYKTPTAERKIKAIIKWSTKEWNKKTAIKYSMSIEKVIKSVAEGRISTKINPEFSTRFSYYTAKRHYIFFEIQQDKLIVVTIFHTSMNVKKRISEEISRINYEVKK